MSICAKVGACITIWKIPPPFVTYLLHYHGKPIDKEKSSTLPRLAVPAPHSAHAHRHQLERSDTLLKQIFARTRLKLVMIACVGICSSYLLYTLSYKQQSNIA